MDKKKFEEISGIKLLDLHIIPYYPNDVIREVLLGMVEIPERKNWITYIKPKEK
jgi:hypothetical protein